MIRRSGWSPTDRTAEPSERQLAGPQIGTISTQHKVAPATDYSPLSATINSANVRTSAYVLAAMARARAATKTIFAIALSLGEPLSQICCKRRFIAVTGITIRRVGEGHAGLGEINGP